MFEGVGNLGMLKMIDKENVDMEKVDRKKVAFFHTGKRLPFSTLKNDRHGKRLTGKRLYFAKLEKG